MARPNAPASLTVTRLADRDFRFTWPAVAGATSYGIVYLTGSQQPPFTQWVKGIKGTSFTGRGFAGEAGKRFAVYATNADGNSAYSPVSGPWYLPVKAPTSLKVRVNREATGARQVVLSWASSAYYQSGVEVEEQVSGGSSSFYTVGSGTGGSVGKAFTVASPANGRVRYRVRHFVGAVGAASRVFGAWSAWSSYVDIEPVAPLAPVTKATGDVAVGGRPVVSWRHVPLDYTWQDAAEVSYRRGTSGDWTTLTFDSSGDPESWTVPGVWSDYETPDFFFSWPLPGSWVAGTYSVMVRTRGSAAGFGEWSPAGVFRVVSRPVVAVTGPNASFTGGRVTVSWTYTQAEGLPQSAYVARLKQGNTVLEELSGVGPGLSASFNTDLSNSTAYSVEVVASCGGVMGTATKSFTTAFKPPAPPSLSAAWHEGMGMHQVDAAPASSFDSSTQAATVSVDVYRSIDAGEHWEHVGEFASAVAFADPGGLSAGVTLYRAVAATDLGALATVEVAAVSASPAVWLHNAEGVGVGLRHNLDWSMPEAVEHAETIWFDGDTIPTWLEDAPKSYSRRLSVSATTLPDRVDDQARAEREALKALLRGVGRVTARLPNGDIITGGMTGISPSVAVSGVGKVSVSVTEAR